jgi:hypothetical protein
MIPVHSLPPGKIVPTSPPPGGGRQVGEKLRQPPSLEGEGMLATMQRMRPKESL